jgi:hypothetical protein
MLFYFCKISKKNKKPAGIDFNKLSFLQFFNKLPANEILVFFDKGLMRNKVYM